MIHLKNKIGLGVLFIGLVLMSCSKSDKNSEKEEETSTGIHTFEVTLVNTDDASDKITFSGEMPMDQGGAVYTDKTIGSERIHEIMLNIGKTDKPNSIFGLLNLDDNKQPISEFIKAEDGAGGASLTIRPKDTEDYYQSVSGLITVKDLRYAMVMSSNGVAAFTLDFEGEFIKNARVVRDAEVTYKATGTLTIAENKEMGTYKKP